MKGSTYTRLLRKHGALGITVGTSDGTHFSGKFWLSFFLLVVENHACYAALSLESLQKIPEPMYLCMYTLWSQVDLGMVGAHVPPPKAQPKVLLKV